MDCIIVQIRGHRPAASGFGPGSGIEEISADGPVRVSITRGSTNGGLDFS